MIFPPAELPQAGRYSLAEIAILAVPPPGLA